MTYCKRLVTTRADDAGFWLVATHVQRQMSAQTRESLEVPQTSLASRRQSVCQRSQRTQCLETEGQHIQSIEPEVNQSHATLTFQCWCLDFDLALNEPRVRHGSLKYCCHQSDCQHLPYWQMSRGHWPTSQSYEPCNCCSSRILRRNIAGQCHFPGIPIWRWNWLGSLVHCVVWRQAVPAGSVPAGARQDKAAAGDGFAA